MAMNLGYMLTRSACARPDHPAVIHGDRILTYSEFDRRVNRLVGMLRSVGLEAGDRVGILSPNCPEILEALFGIWKAGFVAVPMNFRLHPQEVAYILEHSGAKVLLYHSDLTAMVEEGMSCGSAGPMLIHFGSGRAAEGSQPYDGLLAVSTLPMLQAVVRKPMACVLPGPFTLARYLGGTPFLKAFQNGDDQWESLLDACLLTVTDAVKLALGHGSLGVVFWEDFRHLPALDLGNLFSAYTTCFNVLKHHARRCLVVTQGFNGAEPAWSRFPMVTGFIYEGRLLVDLPHSAENGGLPLKGGGLGVYAWSLAEAEFDAVVCADLSSLVVSPPRIIAPVLPCTALPERVRSLVTTVRRG